MEIRDFKSYKIAGMAVMYNINYTFNITKIFPLITIAWRRLNNPRHADIISLKYGTFQRGCGSVSSGCMKNMIMARISIKGQIVSIKFNSDKIHVCGTKDYEVPRMVCKAFLTHLDILYDTILLIKTDRERYNKFINDYTGDDLKGFIKYIEDHRGSYDDDILNFIENQIYDYIHGSYGRSDITSCRQQLLHMIDQVDDIDEVPDDFEIIKENTNMLNYNYDIGEILDRPIRLIKFNTIEKLMGIKNCVINADNRVKQSITIQIRSKDGHMHRIIINRNGKIIHSSHNMESMENIYNKLMSILLDDYCIEDKDLYKVDRYDLKELLGL